MCGRYAITLPPEAVRAWFGYTERPNFPPRYNIAPTQPIPIVRRDPFHPHAPARHFALVRWGFVPSFAKDFAAVPLIINARAEGLADKPSFRAAMIRRRCLVIADGYYEWRRAGSVATPFLIRRREGTPFAFAGLWEGWMGADGSEMETACIVTRAACGLLAGIHPRGPVILDPRDYAAWLDGDSVGPDAAARLLRPGPDEALQVVQVGPLVNKAANDDPAIQAPVGTVRPPDDPAQGSLF